MTFDDSQHPRGTGGRFAETGHDEAPDIDLSEPTAAGLIAHLEGLDPDQPIGPDDLDAYFDRTPAPPSGPGLAKVLTLPVVPAREQHLAELQELARRYVNDSGHPAAAEFAEDRTLTPEGLRAWQDTSADFQEHGWNKEDQDNVRALTIALEVIGAEGNDVQEGIRPIGAEPGVLATERRDLYGRLADGPDGQPAVTYTVDGEPAGHQHRRGGELHDPESGKPAEVTVVDGTVVMAEHFHHGLQSDSATEPGRIHYGGDDKVSAIETFRDGVSQGAVHFDETGNVTSATGPGGDELPDVWRPSPVHLAERYPTLPFRAAPAA